MQRSISWSGIGGAGRFSIRPLLGLELRRGLSWAAWAVVADWWACESIQKTPRPILNGDCGPVVTPNPCRSQASMCDVVDEWTAGPLDEVELGCKMLVKYRCGVAVPERRCCPRGGLAVPERHPR